MSYQCKQGTEQAPGLSLVGHLFQMLDFTSSNLTFPKGTLISVHQITETNRKAFQQTQYLKPFKSKE